MEGMQASPGPRTAFWKLRQESLTKDPAAVRKKKILGSDWIRKGDGMRMEWKGWDAWAG
jgi:hypothetical protein